jgi:outer membrane protein
MFKKFKIFSALLVVASFPVASLSTASGASAASAPAPLESVAVATADGPLFLTVDALVAQVRSQSPQVLFERESVRRALEQSFQAKAALLPQIALTASQTRQQFGRGFAGGRFDSPAFNSFGVRLEGTLSIIDTNSYANYRLAQLSHTIAEKEFEIAVQDILDQALMLYFAQLRDLRQVEIIEGNIERNQGLLALARQRFDAGVTIRIDVTRAEVRVRTEARSLMEAQTEVANSMLQLKALLDLDFDRTVSLDRSMIEDIKPPSTLKRYAVKGELIDQRPELWSQAKQLEQSRLASRAASWQRLPTVEVFGDFGYDSGEALDGDHAESWIVGVRASIPIFEGGRIAAKKREARAAVRQNEYLMRDLHNRIEREYRIAMLEMDSRYEQMGMARDEIRLGSDEVEQAEERYREGLADNTELINAQQRLADAEQSNLRAMYLYGLGRLAFARSIGAVERVLD